MGAEGGKRGRKRRRRRRRRRAVHALRCGCGLCGSPVRLGERRDADEVHDAALSRLVVLRAA